jgi:hypothetical protein
MGLSDADAEKKVVIAQKGKAGTAAFRGTDPLRPKQRVKKAKTDYASRSRPLYSRISRNRRSHKGTKIEHPLHENP